MSRPHRAAGPQPSVEAQLASLDRRPLISVVMPTYKTEPGLLAEAIELGALPALPGLGAVHRRRRLRPSPRCARTIERHAEADERIKTVQLERNSGISAATNAALALCAGEFVAFLDHDDVLSPDALLRVVHELARRP